MIKAVPKPNENSQTLAAAPITQLLGIDGKNIITCSSCAAVREKENMTHIVDLAYPRKVCAGRLFPLLQADCPQTPNEPSPLLDFEGILHHSLLRQMTHKATCQTCKQFANFSSRRSLPSRDLPPILAVNACVYNEENLAFWLDARAQTFMKPRIQLHGQIDGIDDPEASNYELRVSITTVSH